MNLEGEKYSEREYIDLNVILKEKKANPSKGTAKKRKAGEREEQPATEINEREMKKL